jgi:hypothetical protein
MTAKLRHDGRFSALRAGVFLTFLVGYPIVSLEPTGLIFAAERAGNVRWHWTPFSAPKDNPFFAGPAGGGNGGFTQPIKAGCDTATAY